MLVGWQAWQKSCEPQQRLPELERTLSERNPDRREKPGRPGGGNRARTERGNTGRTGVETEHGVQGWL